MTIARLTDCLSGVTHERARANLVEFLKQLDAAYEIAGDARQDKEQGRRKIHRSERVDGQPRYAHYRTGDRRPPEARHYSLREKVIPRLMDEFNRTRRVPNPYRPGCYHFIIESLKSLGVDRYHSFHALRAKVEDVMGPDGWRAFAKREKLRSRPRHIENVEADAVARLQYNCLVLQRTRNYGLKLLQVGLEVMKTAGCVIDVIEAGHSTMYRLNTQSSEPLRQRYGFGTGKTIR